MTITGTNLAAENTRNKTPYKWKLRSATFALLAGITFLGTIAILGAMT